MQGDTLFKADALVCFFTFTHFCAIPSRGPNTNKILNTFFFDVEWRLVTTYYCSLLGLVSATALCELNVSCPPTCGSKTDSELHVVRIVLLQGGQDAQDVLSV